MGLCCLVSMLHACGGLMVQEIFSWHTFGPVAPTEYCLNTTAYLNVVADHVHASMTTVYLSQTLINLILVSFT